MHEESHTVKMSQEQEQGLTVLQRGEDSTVLHPRHPSPHGRSAPDVAVERIRGSNTQMWGTCSSGHPLWLIPRPLGHTFVWVLPAAPQSPPWEAWACSSGLPCLKAEVWAAQLQMRYCVNPSSSESEVILLGFNFDQVECQLFFFFYIIRKPFNRFSPVDLRSGEEIQGRKIRPILSFGFAETSYSHPINSRSCATLRPLKTQP